MDFSGLIELVHQINTWERRIVCIVHPDASGIIDSPKFGGIRTETGPCGYVLTTGERIKI